MPHLRSLKFICHRELQRFRADGAKNLFGGFASFAVQTVLVAFAPSESARGLAHSKTLRAIRGSPVNAPASWSAAALRRFSHARKISGSNVILLRPQALSPLLLLRSLKFMFVREQQRFRADGAKNIFGWFVSFAVQTVLVAFSPHRKRC